MKWYIGQPIVAIINHSQGVFKKGDEFIIRGLKTSPCNCKNVIIDIGFITNKTIQRYCECHKHDRYDEDRDREFEN